MRFAAMIEHDHRWLAIRSRARDRAASRHRSVFTATPTFARSAPGLYCCSAACPRPAARAVAPRDRILLDSVLAEDARARDAYLAAIALRRTLDQPRQWRVLATRNVRRTRRAHCRDVSRQHGAGSEVAFRVERA
jgi:hypothetical protein